MTKAKSAAKPAKCTIKATETEEHFEVDTSDSGASKFKHVQTSTLKKGSYVLIRARPCKVTDISTSKPGKHGSAKCHIIANDIFTAKKMEEISPAHAMMHAPLVVRKEFTLSNISDGFLETMDKDGVAKDDIRLPDNELGTQVKTWFNDGSEVVVTVISAMGEEMIVDVKVQND